jgi:antitoxin FitA
MRPTCMHAPSMSRMIQIRNVPDVLHRKLKARAALEGRSLSDYLLGELRKVAERPTLSEMLVRLERPVREELRPSAADLLRAERDQR